MLNEQGDVQLCGYFNIPSQPPVPPDQLARIEKQRMADLQRQRALDEEHAFDEHTASISTEKSGSVRRRFIPRPAIHSTSSLAAERFPTHRYAGMRSV